MGQMMGGWTPLADPQVWTSLLTLTLLEIVLGIDNLVFLSIQAGRLLPGRQPPAASGWPWPSCCASRCWARSAGSCA